MLELFLFVVLGIIVGILFGLIPGLHPNFLLLLSPLLFSISASPQNLIAFVMAMAVSNSISDFIPSILLGAPDEGTELSVNPGHRMLLSGQGYQAVKLAVVGGLFSVIIISILFPLVALLFPVVYAYLQPVLFFVLSLVSIYMILAEGGKGKIIALVCFLLAGAVGIYSRSIPIDASLLLFPILSGLFGGSILIMQFRKYDVRLEKQRPEEYVSGRLIKRSALFGAVGGIFSGLLPGVGASQMASVATVDKNEKSFLVTLGALAASNIIISVVALWLIGKARSGASVIIANFTALSFGDVLLVLSVALFAAAVASLITLKLAKIFLLLVERINYVLVSKAVFVIILAVVVVFTGVYGLFLFVVCTSLGIFAHTSKIRMSVLMGVLLLPTTVFYYPF